MQTADGLLVCCPVMLVPSKYAFAFLACTLLTVSKSHSQQNPSAPQPGTQQTQQEPKTPETEAFLKLDASKALLELNCCLVRTGNPTTDKATGDISISYQSLYECGKPADDEAPQEQKADSKKGNSGEKKIFGIFTIKTSNNSSNQAPALSGKWSALKKIVISLDTYDPQSPYLLIRKGSILLNGVFENDVNDGVLGLTNTRFKVNKHGVLLNDILMKWFDPFQGAGYSFSLPHVTVNGIEYMNGFSLGTKVSTIPMYISNNLPYDAKEGSFKSTFIKVMLANDFRNAPGTQSVIGDPNGISLQAPRRSGCTFALSAGWCSCVTGIGSNAFVKVSPQPAKPDAQQESLSIACD